MDDIASPTEPANLRFLRRLVTVLTATMILGVLTIVALLVIRLQTPTPPTLPAQLTLPDDKQALSITQTDRYWSVITTDHTLLIFTRDGLLHQSVQLTPVPE